MNENKYYKIYAVILIVVSIIILEISSVFAAFSEFYATETSAVITNSDIDRMLTWSERIIGRETTAEKIELVSEYIEQSNEDFVQVVKGALPAKLSVRSALEIQICRLAQLYRIEEQAEEKEALAEKIYTALILFAQNHSNIKSIYDYGTISSEWYTVQPMYMAIAYNLLGNYNTDEFDILYNTNTRTLIENWLYDTAQLTYNDYAIRIPGNLSGYTVKHMAGLATILNKPEIMHWAIFIADKAMAQQLWFADGMWWEGTVSYGKQLYGNIKEAIPLMSKFVDPEGYEDDLLGISLDGSDLSSRWPMIGFAEQAVGKPVNPDGTIIAVNDTHPTYTSVVGKNLPIKNEYLSNVEFNHFGLFALKSGNTQDAQQVSLLFPSIQSGMPFYGSHTHGSFLTMTFWACGQELLPDAGYPHDTRNHRYMHISPVAHNGAWIYDSSAKNYTAYANKFARPKLLRYDDGSSNGGNIQLIEAKQLMDSTLNIEDNRRLLMLIKTSENTSYVFDLQTLKGGTVHENFLRGSEDESITVEINDEIEAVATAEDLCVYLNNNGKSGLMADKAGLQSYDNFTDASVYSGENGIRFSFVGDKSGSKINVFSKGNANSELYFSTMPSLRRTGGNASLRDNYPTKHFYQRREVDDEITKYATVYEGISSSLSAKVQAVDWYETDNAVFAIVDLGEYEDIICISDNDELKQYDGINFFTEIAHIRRNKSDKKIQNGYIYGEGAIYTDEGVMRCDEGFSANVNSVKRSLYGENSVVVSEKIPDDLTGRWGTFSFADGSGLSHKITKTDGETVYIHNDAGFEFSQNKSCFTSYPAYEKTASKDLLIIDTLYSKVSPRIIDGEVNFSVERTFYGTPTQGVVCYEENGGIVNSVKSDTSYNMQVLTNEENYILYVAIFYGVTDNEYKLYDVKIAKGSEPLKFTLSNNAPYMKVKCMLWNDALSPLCKEMVLKSKH